MRSFTLYDIASSLKSDLRLKFDIFAGRESGIAGRLPGLSTNVIGKNKLKSELFGACEGFVTEGFVTNTFALPSAHR
jgi:hypothetical protein